MRAAAAGIRKHFDNDSMALAPLNLSGECMEVREALAEVESRIWHAKAKLLSMIAMTASLLCATGLLLLSAWVRVAEHMAQQRSANGLLIPAWRIVSPTHWFIERLCVFSAAGALMAWMWDPKLPCAAAQNTRDHNSLCLYALSGHCAHVCCINALLNSQYYFRQCPLLRHVCCKTTKEHSADLSTFDDTEENDSGNVESDREIGSALPSLESSMRTTTCCFCIGCDCLQRMEARVAEMEQFRIESERRKSVALETYKAQIRNARKRKRRRRRRRKRKRNSETATVGGGMVPESQRQSVSYTWETDSQMTGHCYAGAQLGVVQSVSDCESMAQMPGGQWLYGLPPTAVPFAGAEVGGHYPVHGGIGAANLFAGMRRRSELAPLREREYELVCNEESATVEDRRRRSSVAQILADYSVPGSGLANDRLDEGSEEFSISTTFENDSGSDVMEVMEETDTLDAGMQVKGGCEDGTEHRSVVSAQRKRSQSVVQILQQIQDGDDLSESGSGDAVSLGSLLSRSRTPSASTEELNCATPPPKRTSPNSISHAGDINEDSPGSVLSSLSRF